MPRTRTALAAQAQRTVVEQSRAFQDQLNEYGGNLAQALPRHVSLEKFKRVAATAVSHNPDLLRADRRTLFLALVKAASDGLMPDGRECALVVYNTEFKHRDPATGLDQRYRTDAVQYMPMIQGIRERMRRTGQVASADAHVVREKDRFKYVLGDDASIEHEPPPLGQDRGPVVGAYAIIKLRNGEILRDVMSKQEIENTRSVSRAKDGPMWSKFYDEAARKTVLRRCSKAAPQTAELEELLNRDDEPPIVPEAGDFERLSPIEPEPERTEFPSLRNDFYDEDGVVHEEPPAEPAGGPGAPGSAQGAGIAAAEEQQAPAPPERPNYRAQAKVDDRPFPGDQPSGDVTNTYVIPVPQVNGKADYRRWAFGLFLPKVRQMMSSADLAVLCGDNEAELAAAKRHLAAGDLRELEALITQRWDEIAEMEKEEAV